MRVKLKRVLSFVSAFVICGVSCVTSWFSVPVSAAGAFGMLEWLEFQTLLQGIGVSGNNSDFADSVQDWIDGIGGPEMPREEYDGKWMTNYEYYNRLGWDSIIDWCDGLFSGDNSYTDIPDVGTDVSGGGNGFLVSPDGSSVNLDFVFLTGVGSNVSPVTAADGSYGWIDAFSANKYVSSDVFGASHKYIIYCSDGIYFIYTNVSNLNYSWQTSQSTFWIHFASASGGGASGFSFPGSQALTSSVRYNCISRSGFVSNTLSLLHAMGVDLSMTSMSISEYVSKIDYSNYIPADGFTGPVYTYPAAQDLYKSTGTAAGIRLDVQTQDGVPDMQAALDGAGVDTVDDLVAGVAAGTVPMSKVLADAKVTPYVVADTATGAVVTDLGVSATAAGVKAVGLTQELAIPKDLTNAVAYPIKGKTWDPDMAKYKLPLFQFFPFCLPWDIYEVLTLFDAEPVAPKFTIPVGQFFTRFSGSVDTSKAADQKAVVDLGADSWQSTFKVIRALECAAIIIGLCLTAVLLIHGGR